VIAERLDASEKLPTPSLLAFCCQTMSATFTNEAFDAAYERFINSLPEKDRERYALCASADDLLEGLTKLEVLSVKRQKTRSRQLLRGIKTFSDHLQPYFDTLGVLAQSNQYSCIAWGSLRLVLQVRVETFF